MNQSYQTHPLLAQNLTTGKAAVYNRLRKLHSDQAADKAAEASKRAARRKKDIKLKSKASELNSMLQRGGGVPIMNRIKFHLSKGRDVGDIAVRERLRVSDVQAMIDHLKSEGDPGNKP